MTYLMRCVWAATLALACVIAAGSARAADSKTGCWPAVLAEVADGDTVAAFYATSDPLQWGFASIRVYGIDTPEKQRSEKTATPWPAKCRAEADLGKAASAYMAKRLEPFLGARGDPRASRVRVCDLQADKYHGRKVARVQLRESSMGWTDIGETMLAMGLAFPYDGGRKASWCACLEKGACPAGYRGKRP